MGVDSDSAADLLGVFRRQAAHSLPDMFRLGLPVQVLQYQGDDNDRDSRECWNVASHDEGSFSVRWASVGENVRSALTHHRRH